MPAPSVRCASVLTATKCMVGRCAHMFSTGCLHEDLGPDHFERRDKERRVRYLVAQIQRLGVEVQVAGHGRLNSRRVCPTPVPGPTLPRDTRAPLLPPVLMISGWPHPRVSRKTPRSPPWRPGCLTTAGASGRFPHWARYAPAPGLRTWRLDTVPVDASRGDAIKVIRGPFHQHGEGGIQQVEALHPVPYPYAANIRGV